MPLEVTAPVYGAPNANDPVGTRQDLGDKDIFLKLLIAQMQYQDPLDPTDSTQMSAQLAQFNMVEQQTESNKLLEQLVAAQSAGGASGDSAASYLGKSVTVNQSLLNFSGSPESFAINLNGTTNQNYVIISDSEGTPIRTYSLGPLPVGSHALNWDGSTDAGVPALHGNYYVDVISTDTDGNSISSTVQRSGVVDAVRITATGVQLMVGGTATDISDVTEIRL